MGVLKLIAILALTASVLGCGDDSDSAALSVTLTNYSVEAERDLVPAGRTTITAVHDGEHAHGDSDGGQTHQLLVARLAEGTAAGDGDYDEVVLNLDDIEIGESRSGEVELQPGRYELACMVVEEVGGESIDHYAEGMYSVLTVE